MRTSLQDGSHRVTTWSTVEPHSMTVLQDGSIYFGRENGIFKYGGYTDDGSEYLLLYYSNPLNFGNSTNLKFLKKFNITVIGSVEANTTLVWGYDYTNNFNKKVFSSSATDSTQALFGISEYGLSQYTIGTDIQRPKINTNGSGTVVTIGIESTINGSPYSIQQIDIHALLGRLI